MNLLATLLYLFPLGQVPTPLPVFPDKDLVPLEVKSAYVARKPPVFISMAPDPSVAHYDWVWPTKVVAKARDNTLEISYAPAGEVVIEVIVTYGNIVDGKIIYTKKLGVEKFVMADTGQIPPIPPPLPAIDPFVAIFQSAYSLDPDPDKAANTIQLAGLYNVSSTKVLDPAFVGTVGDVYSKMKQASFNLKLTDKIVMVRTSVQVELDKILPKTPQTVLDTNMRKLFSDTYKRVELALGQCK